MEARSADKDADPAFGAEWEQLVLREVAFVSVYSAADDSLPGELITTVVFILTYSLALLSGTLSFTLTVRYFKRVVTSSS